MSNSKSVYKAIWFEEKYHELKKAVIVNLFIAWTIQHNVMAVLSLIKDEGLVRSAWVAMTFAAIGAIFGNDLGGRLADRYGPKWVMRIGLLALLIFNVGVLTLQSPTGNYLVMVVPGVQCALMGIVQVSNAAAVSILLPKDENEKLRFHIRLTAPGYLAAGIGSLTAPWLTSNTSFWNVPDLVLCGVAICVALRFTFGQTEVKKDTTADKTEIQLVSQKLSVVRLCLLVSPAFVVGLVNRGVISSVSLVFDDVEAGVITFCFFIANGLGDPSSTGFSIRGVGLPSVRRSSNDGENALLSLGSSNQGVASGQRSMDVCSSWGVRVCS